MFNEVILIGKLACKPVIKTTGNGSKMASAVIEVERPYRNSLGVREKDYINCILWKGLAETILSCCEEGSFIGLRGRIQSRSHENNDKEDVNTLEVKVEHLSLLEKYINT